MDPTIQTQDIVTVSKAVSDFGFTVVASAVFLLMSIVVMLLFVLWAKSIINNMMKSTAHTQEQLLEETRQQNEMLANLSECLLPENMARVKVVSNALFDLAVEKVCRVVKKVRTENHIDDLDATKAKVQYLITNIYDDRNSRLDAFSFKGKPLSSYTDTKWIDNICTIVLDEIYKDENNGRTYSNVQSAYERIKIEFYKKLKR